MRKYEECATRLEHRGDVPPTREYVDSLVESLLETGVEASWHSGVDREGRALFPSKVYPNCHPGANFESFHYLIERLHNIGRPIISWYPLNMAKGVAEAHPDWQMQLVEQDAELTPEQQVNLRRQVCFNSPYGELLPRFAVELVKDVGFDGIFFDGSTFTFMGTPCTACGCDFCRKRFKKDTGLKLPGKVDYEDPDFRIWVNWRYDVLMNVWREIVEAVKEVKPEATICFNNLRRRLGGGRWWGTWNTGIPMRKIGLDAIMGCELDGHPFQADIQMKINRAYGFKKGVENWWCLGLDYGFAPGQDNLTAIQAVLGCISGGGITSCGTLTIETSMDTLKEMEKAAVVRFPYVGGRTVEYAAIVASQQTMDFWAKGDYNKVWNEIHGANEILLHSHLQSAVIFDDHLEKENLARYPLIILGNMVCISKKQAQKLYKYAKSGGTLFASDKVGELDEMGYPHEKPVLDELLGIVSREEAKGLPVLKITDKKLKSACRKYPLISLRTSHTKVESASDTLLLGQIYDCLNPLREWDNENENWPGLWQRRVGKGNIVYLSADLLSDYLLHPTPAAQQFFQSLITSLVEPVITLEAPTVVTMNVREQRDGVWAVHLYNNPGSSYRYGQYAVVGEVVPVRDIVIKLNKSSVKSAQSATTGKSCKVIDGSKVIIPELLLQDIILLQLHGIR